MPFCETVLNMIGNSIGKEWIETSQTLSSSAWDDAYQMSTEKHKPNNYQSEWQKTRRQSA